MALPASVAAGPILASDRLLLWGLGTELGNRNFDRRQFIAARFDIHLKRLEIQFLIQISDSFMPMVSLPAFTIDAVTPAPKSLMPVCKFSSVEVALTGADTG